MSWPRTEGLPSNPVSTERSNCFDLLRFISAGFVLVGHHWTLSGLSYPEHWLYGLLGMGVPFFFAISGYLVSASWERDPSPGRFLVRRVLRIFPALLVLVLLTVFVFGPLATRLPAGSYFGSADTWHYLWNALLYFVGPLPGVFTGNPYTPYANGSLWTLCMEFSCYLSVVACGLLAGASTRSRTALAVSLYLACEALNHIPATRAALGNMQWFGVTVAHYPEYARYFLAGAIFFHMRWRPSGWTAAWLPAVLIVSGLQLLGSALGSLLLVWGAAALAVGIGTVRVPARWRFGSADLSYGIYIFAFPVDQWLLSQGVGFVGGYFLLWLLTLMMAAPSWYLVEKPALALKSRMAPR